MKKKIIILCASIYSIYAGGSGEFSKTVELPKIVTSDFKEFVSILVAKDDQKAFADFYLSLIEREGTVRGKQSFSIEQRKKEIINLGECYLEIRKESIFKELKPFLREVNSDRAKIVQKFLYRCGAYEKFLQNTHKKGQPIMVKMQNYMLEAKNKVISVAHKLDPRKIFATH